MVQCIIPVTKRNECLILQFELTVFFPLLQFVFSKAKRRISKRVFQKNKKKKNKSRQIFLKMNISYPLAFSHVRPFALFPFSLFPTSFIPPENIRKP